MARHRQNTQWSKYEELAHQIVKELMPYAELTLDDHVYGESSEVIRQIDVSAKWNVDGQEYLLIVQVKDLSRRADINTLGTFKSVISSRYAAGPSAVQLRLRLPPTAQRGGGRRDRARSQLTPAPRIEDLHG